MTPAAEERPRTEDPRIDTLTHMVFDLYAQNRAILDLMQTQGVGLPIGYITESKRKAKASMLSALVANGYVDTPSAEKLREMAEYLAKG